MLFLQHAVFFSASGGMDTGDDLLAALEAEEVVSGDAHGAEDPGNGIAQINDADVVDEAEHHGQPCHSEHADANGRDNGDGHGLAGASDGTAKDIGEGEGAGEGGHILHHAQGELLDLCLLGEEVQHIVGGEENGDAQQGREAEGHDLAELDALTHTAELTCADVLAHIGGHGQAKSHKGHIHEAVDLGIGSHTGHSHGAEAVDLGLDQQVGNVEHGALQSTGDGHLHKLDEDHTVELHLQGMIAVFLVELGEPQDGQHSGDTLGNDSGGSGTGHAPAQHGHEEQVQHQIGEAAGHQVYQGALGVAFGPEHTGTHVIDHGDDGTGQVYAKICHGIGEDFLRGVHPNQQLPGEQHTQNGYHYAGAQAQYHGGVNELFQTWIVLGTVIHGIQDAGTGGQAQEEADEQVDEGAGGTNCRQGQLAAV